MKTDHFFLKSESLNLKNLLKSSVHYLAQNTVKKKSLKPLKSKYNFPNMFTENITGVGKGTKEDTEKRAMSHGNRKEMSVGRRISVAESRQGACIWSSHCKHHLQRNTWLTLTSWMTLRRFWCWEWITNCRCEICSWRRKSPFERSSTDTKEKERFANALYRYFYSCAPSSPPHFSPTGQRSCGMPYAKQDTWRQTATKQPLISSDMNLNVKISSCQSSSGATCDFLLPAGSWVKLDWARWSTYVADLSHLWEHP